MELKFLGFDEVHDLWCKNLTEGKKYNVISNDNYNNIRILSIIDDVKDFVHCTPNKMKYFEVVK